MLNYDEILKEMKEISEKYNYEVERGHALADDLLCKFLKELGYGELIDIYDEVDKWYA